jgi:hypothetical protein
MQEKFHDTKKCHPKPWIEGLKTNGWNINTKTQTLVQKHYTATRKLCNTDTTKTPEWYDMRIFII